MLPPGFLHAFRGPDFQVSGDHAARLPGGQASRGFQGARLSGARGPETGDQASMILPIPGDRGPGSGGQASRWLSGGQGLVARLSGYRGPGPGLRIHKINAAGCFQQRPIIYVMSSFPFSPNYFYYTRFFFIICINIHISRI